MTQEIEIRLAFRPEDRPRLYGSPALKRLSSGRASGKHLNSVYFDTTDLALAQRGLTLRVCKSGKKYVQCVKGPSSAADPFGLEEWETVLPSDAPNPISIPDRHMRELVESLLAQASLEPQLGNEIHRTIRHLKTAAGDEIECAFDDGSIRGLHGTNGEVAVMELELELKSGSRSALFEVARELNRVAALTLQTESKSERGMRALMGRGAEAQKPERVVLAEDASAEEAFRTTLRHCLDHIARNVPAVVARQPAGVHQIRVGLRRLRAAMTAFGEAFRGPGLEDLRVQAKRLADAFGATRALDVFADEMLPDVEPQVTNLRGVNAVRAQLAGVRARSWDNSVALVRSGAFTDFLLALGAAAEIRIWRSGAMEQDVSMFERPALELANESLPRELRKSCKRAKHLSRLRPDQRHRLRIAVKKLRYAAEFFAPLFADKHVGPYLKQVSKTQDAFGELNDASTVQHVLTLLLEAPDTPESEDLREGAAFIAGWHLGRVKGGWLAARKQWKRLAKATPFWESD